MRETLQWCRKQMAVPRGDLVMLAGFAAVAEIERAVSTTNVFAGSLPPAADAVAVLLPLLPLLWRSARPFGALVAAAILMTFNGAVLHATIPFFGGLFPFLVLLYSASARAAPPRQALALGVPVALIGPMPLYVSTFQVPSDYAFAFVSSAFAWVAGQAARRWRQQSEQLAGALEEVRRGREVATRLALADERLRIARDVHDVVAHSLSVIVLQASAARLDERSSAAGLRAIERTGREALSEIRQVLGFLRHGEDVAPGTVSGFAALPDLLGRLRMAGLDVELRIEGEAESLPEIQDSVASRVLQEGLTNALKHGGESDGRRRARLLLRYEPGQVTISLRNPLGSDGAGSAALPPSGLGLIGVRERVARTGGSCTTGPDGSGDFALEVVLPVSRTATRTLPLARSGP